jgi:hypothetical protein
MDGHFAPQQIPIVPMAMKIVELQDVKNLSCMVNHFN